MEKVFVAVHPDYKETLVSCLEEQAYSIHVITTLLDFTRASLTTGIIFIDEDFDGLETGWQLAHKIRQLRHPIRIVMFVRRNPGMDLIPIYDHVIGIPFDIGEVIGEIERRPRRVHGLGIVSG